MVNLTRIYTRTGDDGTTALGDFSRTTKNDLRLRRLRRRRRGQLPRSGVALASGGLADDVRAVLRAIQNDLFDVGADLCTPVVPNPTYPPLRVQPEYVDAWRPVRPLQRRICRTLRSFILPGRYARSAPTARGPHRHPARRACGLGGD